jgi:hypothetical protein
LFSPNLTEQTLFSSMLNWSFDPGNSTILAGRGAQTTAFDGFTLFPSAHTFTGTVRVYGYKD